MTKKIELEIVDDINLFDKFKEGSYYTITGCGGDLRGWVDGVSSILQERHIGTPLKFYIFSGRQMNEKYGLSGAVAYKNDLTFLAFPIDNLEAGKLSMFKMQMGDRWFDDIVWDNEQHMKGF